MKKITLFICFNLLFISEIYTQNNIKGVIKDNISSNPLQNVSVSIKETDITQKTSINGEFHLQNLSNEKHLIIIEKEGYETQNLPVNLSKEITDLGTIFMYKKPIIEDEEINTIIISEDELNDETNYTDNISGLLQSSKDIYLKTIAYEWSPAFYRIRGLDSENSKVLINGIEMNKLYNGRPQWNNWGGLNDMVRNQTFSNGLTPSNYNFGGVLGSTNINTRASKYRKGNKVSYANSNSSYNHRIMASYSSGILKKGWAFTIGGSYRNGKEGYVDGTSYNSYSALLSVEKNINEKHSLNFTSILSSTKRGKSAGHTQEVYDLKGIKYNEYWGYQNGKKRNSRIKRVFEPIVMLNHYWKISTKTNLNTNISYQFGELGDSRLDYNGGTNPSPTYYQKLPSYWLSKNDIVQTYEAEQRFINNGQIDWESLYSANITNAEQGKNSSFILYEDRNDNKQFTVNTIFDSEINENILLTGKLKYTKLTSNNFAYVLDMLGGNGYLDVNRFGKLNTPERQNNVLNPNRVVKKNDKFKYNYNVYSDVISAFIQGEFKYKKADFYIASNLSKTSHQREGLYKNGRFLNNSFGKSIKKDFTNFGFKTGFTYKISGRHFVDFNTGYLTKAPTIKNTFSNIRENNSIVKNLTNEKILMADASYIYRSPIISSKLTGYYSLIKDATNIGFFYQQGLFGEAFVQEITTGINKKHIGIELGIETQITSSFKVKGALNYGQYIYSNNPNVYVTSEEYISLKNTSGINDLGKSYLKNYRVASGPQKSYSLGFEYNDSDNWWISSTVNYLDDSYINVSSITRSDAFYKSFDGLPINNIDYKKAKKLLKQEKFNNYILVNAIGGKSWKVGKGYKYIGFTAGFSNLLNEKFKTGGYEQSRKPDYTQLLEENNKPKKLFGSKYWYGRGTTYFLNIFYRF
ncbi:MAG: carboxypeptidase-like regulatory domain-containing protein [Tenacibaculum sp.]|nr:carboxypeptidase-like regulatory domain-containing protein [Tenacibaculum sp.]